ncbi:hypothetical protein LCGC14_3111830 [marine sediment metagenome]|uniref:Uncharacterized protein n=1 Tax=marine sediment metagenome TaxID=412755 RepID=A0A0F8WTR7_9ZZZZ
MRVLLPQSTEYFSLRLFVTMPGDDYTCTATIANAFEEIVLPDGVCEDQVGVTARFTDHRSKEVGELIVVKEVVEPNEANVMGISTCMPIEPPIEPILAEPAPSDMAVNQMPGPVVTRPAWKALDVNDKAEVIVQSEIESEPRSEVADFEAEELANELAELETEPED